MFHAVLRAKTNQMNLAFSPKPRSTETLAQRFATNCVVTDGPGQHDHNSEATAMTEVDLLVGEQTQWPLKWPHEQDLTNHLSPSNSKHDGRKPNKSKHAVRAFTTL